MISWTRIITINNSQESGQSISTLCQKIVKNRPKLSNWNSLTAGITWLANIRMIRLWSHFQAINRFELTGENNPFWTSTVPNEINYHLSQKKTARVEIIISIIIDSPRLLWIIILVRQAWKNHGLGSTRHWVSRNHLFGPGNPGP